MSIQALPDSTVRKIGATQVLTDPASVVKELIDNALDANATAISIEISANTIDVIQLRDNGHGVAPDDRSLICRRYCTSKIRDMSDLASIGGSSLGFRGEALASAAELSGDLTITTRVEGEDVAVALKVAKNGEVERRDHASHPIGTTVRMGSLFETLPVRKQTALKGATKCLANVKSLVQQYALARTTVRFSLRILKAKNEKGNWMYAPGPRDSSHDTLSKVVSKDCSAQCVEHCLDVEGYELRALLPGMDADVSKITGAGHFLSVDDRPVATSRGPLKQIMTKFRSAVKAADPRFADVKDPFAWIRVKCPPASYDANVEPAKDDLIFEEDDKLLAAIDKLLDQCYPMSQSRRAEQSLLNCALQESESERPLKRRRLEDREQDLQSDTPVTISRAQPATADGEPLAVESEISPQGLKDVNVSNPWIMAKMHAYTRPRRDFASNEQLLTPLRQWSDGKLNTASETRSKRHQLPPHPPWAALSPNSSPTRRRQQRNSPQSVENDGRLQQELAPEDSVSAVGAGDDIDPSIVHMYQPRPSVRGRQSVRTRTASEERHRPANVARSPKPARLHGDEILSAHDVLCNAIGADHNDDAAPWRVAGPIPSSFKSTGRPAPPYGTGLTQKGDHDIRSAFSSSTPRLTKSTNAGIAFKPFKPVAPQRPVVTNEDIVHDDNTRLEPYSFQTLGGAQHPEGPIPMLVSEKTNATNTKSHATKLNTSRARSAHIKSRTDHLPLEHIPPVCQTGNLVHVMKTDIANIEAGARLLCNTLPSFVLQSKEDSDHVHAGHEPWGMPADQLSSPDDQASSGGTSGLGYTSTLAQAVESSLQEDWRKSILTYLAQRGELERGVAIDMLEEAIENGIMATLGT